jgi:hypothetical protein
MFTIQTAMPCVATGDTTLVGKGAYPSWFENHTLIIEPYFGPA